MPSHPDSARPAPDQVLVDIADYVADYEITSSAAYPIARYCLMDALGCAVEALNFPECIKLLGPIIPEIVVFRGAKVPGTQFTLDPVSAAKPAQDTMVADESPPRQWPTQAKAAENRSRPMPDTAAALPIRMNSGMTASP